MIYGRYERNVHQFLAAYRFLSYAMAVMFSQVVPLVGAAAISDLQMIIILSALGVYSLLKVFSPLRWREGSPSTYVILIGDFAICILLVIYTGGLSSSFLLYSLTPIMTAALFFDERVALSLAATASIFLSFSHLILGGSSSGFAWFMQRYNLTMLVVYTLFCLVAATVPYRINLNIRRRIEREAIIEERRRIAREIHDSVAQTLSYLNLKTGLVSASISTQNTQKALSELSDLRKVVQDTYENMRESIDQLSTDIRSEPLMATLANYVKKFSNDNGIRVQLDVPGTSSRISPVAELQLLRIVQEALTNVRRHAYATEARVKLETTPKAVEMVIKDNGRGFTPLEGGISTSGYHGLNIIKERAEGLGGSLTISTAPGKGTEVMVSFPIEKVRL